LAWAHMTLGPPHLASPYARARCAARGGVRVVAHVRDGMCTLQVSTEEAKALIDGLKNTDSFASNGIILNGQKYMYIKSDGGKEVHGKKVSARHWWRTHVTARVRTCAQVMAAAEA